MIVALLLIVGTLAGTFGYVTESPFWLGLGLLSILIGICQHLDPVDKKST